MLLASDFHLDAPDFDRKACLQDLNRGKDLNARMFFNGDIVSGIISQDKKRWSKSSQKDLREDSLNQLVQEAFDFLEPYVDYIDVIGVGNHESTLLKYHSFDPIGLLIMLLNERRKPGYHPIKHGGYTGFLRFVYTKNGGHGRSFDVFYNHGQGGSAEVTYGIIDLNRYCTWISADLIWLGHKHKRLIAELPTLAGMSAKNNLSLRRRYGVITGCYSEIVKVKDIKKDGYQIDYGEERQRMPQAQHGVILRHTVGEDIHTEMLF
jgi:hypothetical protein